MKPKDVVFDWGCGCGHKLTWLKKLYGVDGIGIDVVEQNIIWADKFAAGKYCFADGNTITDWLPEGLLDHVISFGALYHADDQCGIGRKLIRKLKSTGKAWFGALPYASKHNTDENDGLRQTTYGMSKMTLENWQECLSVFS